MRGKWPRTGNRGVLLRPGIYGEALIRSRENIEEIEEKWSPRIQLEGGTVSKITFLNFEQPISELDSKIEELRFVQDDSAVDISEEIDRLSKKSQQLTKDIYAKLTPWQVSQIARHPQRPYTMDYVNEIFTDFHELHGDRT